MPGSKSQRRAVRIRYQLVVGVFDSSLSVRYRQDVHLKALRKEEWLREHSFELKRTGVKREPQAKPTIGGGRMNHTKSAWANPLGEFQQTMDAAAEKLRNQLEDLEPYCGSQALKFAVRAGLQPQMAYTVSETSKYTGVSASTLYAENKAGRLPFKTIGSRNALIRVVDVDKWMEAKSDGR